MLSGLKRRSRPPPIWIPDLKNARRENGQQQTPSPTASPSPKRSFTSSISTGESTRITTIQATSSLSSLRSTSSHLASLTSRTTLKASITSKQSSISRATLLSPTKTTFVTVTQSLFSPKGKDEDSPKGTTTVFLSATQPPQFVTVTGVPARSTSGILPSSTAALGVTAGANLLPPSAKVPLIIISVIGIAGAVLTVFIIFWRRKKKNSEAKVKAQQ